MRRPGVEEATRPRGVVIAAEEKMLLARFGAEYASYCHAVGRGARARAAANKYRKSPCTLNPKL